MAIAASPDDAEAHCNLADALPPRRHRRRDRALPPGTGDRSEPRAGKATSRTAIESLKLLRSDQSPAASALPFARRLKWRTADVKMKRSAPCGSLRRRGDRNHVWHVDRTAAFRPARLQAPGRRLASGCRLRFPGPRRPARVQPDAQPGILELSTTATSSTTSRTSRVACRGRGSPGLSPTVRWASGIRCRCSPTCSTASSMACIRPDTT